VLIQQTNSLREALNSGGKRIMRVRTPFIAFILFGILLFLTAPLFTAGVDQLQTVFDKPPDDARIMVRWWWFGPAVTKPQLEREMKLMKEGGIGGFEVQPTYPLALDGELPGLRNLKFMSPEFLDALGFTAAKAKELGLRMDLTLGSGWPYGGPQFTRAEAVGALRASAPVNVTTGQTTVAMPAGGGRGGGPGGGEADQIVAAFLGPLLAVPAGGNPYVALKISGNNAVLPSDLRGATQVTFYTLGLPGLVMVKRPAFGADGYIIDHYNPAVIDRFIKEIGEPEIAACGPNPPYAIFCDSLEVSGENWTANLPAEFQKRRGYDLMPLLPALFNDIGPKTMDIRHDWGQTVTEVYNDYFNTPFKKLANAHSSRFRIQGYGTPPAALFSYAYCDLPEGEGYQWKGFSTSRWAASASHVLGKLVTSSETFTWLHSPVFRASPLDMKAEADMHFLEGINQLICHGWPYTAEGVAYPGWSFYAAAVFNEKNPWWIVMPDVTKYIQRVSSMMRQGTPANDVALFLPNSDAWASFGRNFSMNAALQGKVDGLVRGLTDAGFNLDFFDDQLLAMRGKVDGKELAFGDVRYKVVILPGVERIPPATMKTLEEFARAGGIVVATARIPDLAPGYKATDEETKTVRDIARRLFKDANAPGLFVENEAQLADALAKRLRPDVTLSPAAPEIGAVHRHTDGGEVYFVANTGNQLKNVKATFRVEGMQVESWDPMTGRVSPVANVEKPAGGTTVNLNLEPYGSTIFVFTGRALPAPKAAPAVASVPKPVDLSTGWTIKFGRDAKPIQMDRLTSWIDMEGRANFSGVATYEKTITVAPEMLRAGLTLSLNLGQATAAQTSSGGRGGQGYRTTLETPVREAAVVYINDQRVGAVWSPPYVVDVTGLLKPGQNKIRIEAANLAMNYMASIKLPNYNYAGVNQQFGNRFQPQNLDSVQALPSGLLGPVQLVAAQAK
jgi:hypothetical protein